MRKLNVTATVYPIEKASMVALAKTNNMSESEVAATLMRIGIGSMKGKPIGKFRLTYLELAAKAAARQCVADETGESGKYSLDYEETKK